MCIDVHSNKVEKNDQVNKFYLKLELEKVVGCHAGAGTGIQNSTEPSLQPLRSILSLSPSHTIAIPLCL